jgi:hypothetical protein
VKIRPIPADLLRQIRHIPEVKIGLKKRARIKAKEDREARSDITVRDPNFCHLQKQTISIPRDVRVAVLNLWTLGYFIPIRKPNFLI